MNFLSILGNPLKMYPDNANMVYAVQTAHAEDARKGKVRETYFHSHLQNAGIEVFYAEVGDFLLENNTFEIGGKNKKQHQIKDKGDAYIAPDGILTGFKNRIPLYLLGFLY